MGQLAQDVIAAGRERIGMPFFDHFDPEDVCQGGTLTLPSCMEQGLDESGYDCSGFVIASICDVLEMQVREWPTQLRHPDQMAPLASMTRPRAGDLCIPIRPGLAHVFMFTTNQDRIIHASNKEQVVIESRLQKPLSPNQLVRTISLDKLIEVATQ